MEQRQPAYEVILNQSELTITIQSPNGLNDRAMRDITRMQWISIGYGWNFSDRVNPNGNFTEATAKFLSEEFISAKRYFQYCNQGISIKEI